MEELNEKLHRTWVQLLVDNDFKEVAAIAVETNIEVIYDERGYKYDKYIAESIAFDIPTSVYTYIKDNVQIKEIMQRAIKTVIKGHVDCDDSLSFIYRVKLINVEKGWQNIVKNLIANVQNPHQADISKKVFSKKEKQLYVYNDMKFASQSEIRIAQELEARRILFFPLPLAVRADTGDFYQDHREPDFLVCKDGVWGILEVSYHPDRYEKDSEKDSWFKKSGILCVQHYSAERCYNHSSDVVNEFLEILAQHKR